jgi:hypothetical protein
MVNVFFTVDTEFHPAGPNWSDPSFSREIRSDIDGITSKGEFGAFFQADLLKAHGLRGVFFVEALSGYVAGNDWLTKIVSRIQQGSHEVGLHLHPEWLRRAPWASVLPGKHGSLMRMFSLEDQAALIAKGIEQLNRCGVATVHSFRAGGYGANDDTLRALARNGVKYDSSHNSCWFDATCDIQRDELLLQPRELFGVYEFPISFFQDWPGHYRHAELCACSFQELETALLDAWRKKWHSFVIVSHSFELIKGRVANGQDTSRPDGTVIRRFKKLCEFLANNSDKFQTATFDRLDPQSMPSRQYTEPLCGNFRGTLFRLAEQAYRRLS